MRPPRTRYQLLLKTSIIILVAICVGAATWGVINRKGNAETSVDPNAITIPSDLKSRFDESYDELLRAQALIDKRKPELDQILRITLDRAGVNPSEFDKWEFDKTTRSMKKK